MVHVASVRAQDFDSAYKAANGGVQVLDCRLDAGFGERDHVVTQSMGRCDDVLDGWVGYGRNCSDHGGPSKADGPTHRDGRGFG